MNISTRLGKDSFWLFIARLGSQGALALFTIWLARQLGSAGFGEYAFISAVVFIGNMVSTFGTDMLLIREIAADEDFSHLTSSLLVQLVISLLFIGAMFLLPLLSLKSEVLIALQLYSLSLIPLAFFTVFTSVLRGRQRMDLYALLNLATAVGQLLVALIFISSGTHIVAIAWILLIVQVIAAIAAWGLCRRQIPHWQFSQQLIFSALKASAPLAMLGLIGILYQRLSILLATFFLDAPSLGWLAASLRVIEFAKIGHLAVFTALYPAMAKARLGQGAFRVEWLWLIIGACTISVILFLFAAPLTFLLFGADYLATGAVLRLLAWLIIPYMLNTFMTLSFLAISRERPVLYALSLSLCVLIVLNIWWLPAFGLVGAGAALLAAESAQLVVWWWHRTPSSSTGVLHEFSQST